MYISLNIQQLYDIYVSTGLIKCHARLPGTVLFDSRAEQARQKSRQAVIKYIWPLILHSYCIVGQNTIFASFPEHSSRCPSGHFHKFISPDVYSIWLRSPLSADCF